ncbi:MAG: tetratricopeptide repeat protein [Calditrichaeota bacterium]|nr:MAG: tetratricopeptide repeat protein [Calditrichota bacterium]
MAYQNKILFLPVLFVLIVSCSTTKPDKALQSEVPTSVFSTQALNLVITASTEELLDNNEQALLLFQEAQLYDSSSAGIDLAIAKLYQKLGHYESSVRVLEQGLRKDSSHYEILDNLVILKEIKQEYKTVILLYKKMLHLQPFDLAIKNRLARVFEIIGDFSSAIELYEEIVLLENVRPELWETLGNLYLKIEDRANAVRCFKELLSEYPGDEETYLRLGKLLQEIDDMPAAVALYNEAINTNSRFNHVVNELAEIYIATQKPDLAIALYETYYQSDTTSFFKITSLAETHENFGDGQRAHFLFHQLVKIFPQEWRAWVQTGRYEYRQNRLTNSLNHFLKACSLTDDGLPHILLAQNYFQLDSLVAAENTLRFVYPKTSASPDINYLLGLVVKRQNRFNEAVPYFQRVLKINPDHSQAINMLAETYANSRQYSVSDSLYEKALAHAQGKAFVQNNFSFNLAERGVNLEYALTLINDALQSEPGNAAFLDTKGWVLFKMGQLEESLKFIQKSLEIRPENAEVFEHLGDVYLRIGDIDNAVRAWKEALRIDETRETLILKINRHQK